MIPIMQIKPIRAENTIIVPDDYPTIQEAINAASDGDTIYVKAGIYFEHVIVNKSITLHGEDPQTTKISKKEKDYNVVKVTADNVTISNLSIIGARGTLYSRASSIYIKSSSYCNISGNYISSDSYGDGLVLYSSSVNIIHRNKISGDLDGLLLFDSGKNIISNNTILTSFEFHSSDRNEIMGNTINCGIELVWSIHNKFYSNNIHGQVEDDMGNVWNDEYPIGGNYWDDYTGVDEYSGPNQDQPGSDGIGDTSYVLPTRVNNVDHYPLIYPVIDHPIPVIVSVDYTSKIRKGEWANITITARNDGATAEWQTIHVSFPLIWRLEPTRFNPPIPIENIEIVDHDLNGGVEIYLPGTVLPANYGKYNITSEYVVVEGVHSAWVGGRKRENHTMTVRVKPPELDSEVNPYGIVRFYVKTVSRAKGVTYHDPTGLFPVPLDQQDEYVYWYSFFVDMRTPTAYVDSISPNPAEEGKTVTFQGHGEDLDGYIEEYRWESDKDGFLSDQASFNTSSLSVNTHTITFKVKDNDGQWSNPAEEILTINSRMDLVEQYFPILIFDEKEGYFPTSFYCDDTDISNNSNNYDESWPLTAYVHTVEYGDNKDYLCIQYWFYYANDPGKVVIPETPWTDEITFYPHPHDWESVYVFFEKQDADYIPKCIAYFHHVEIWVDLYSQEITLEDCYNVMNWQNPLWEPEKIGTHPVVHVARHSHASYPHTVFDYAIHWAVIGVEPGHDVVKKIPFPIEPCNGGLQRSYNEFQIIYVDEPDVSWPNQFGDIAAPWNRTRWENPEDILLPPHIIKNSFTMLSLHEPGSKLYLHVLDNQSRHVGFNEETSEVETEIPGSYYEDLGNTTFVILPENITDFKVTVDGQYAHEPVETYELVVSTVKDDELVDKTIIESTIEQGKSQDFNIKLGPSGKITIPPTVSIVSPENKTYNVKDVPLTFTVNEAASWIGYSLDGQMNVTITGNTTLTGLSDGSHSLVVHANDTAGNTGASEIIYFTIETQPEPQPAEPFPTWIVAVIVIVVIALVAVLVRTYRKRKP